MSRTTPVSADLPHLAASPATRIHRQHRLAASRSASRI